MSALEQLKKYTTVVSDTGDFEGIYIKLKRREIEKTLKRD